MDEVIEILARLVLEVHSVIYSLISNLYQVFIAIASARIFTADKYQYVANRIYVVIGVAALFFVAYGLLQGIINPDGKNEKGAGGIVKNLIISIILIAFIPAIFNFAYNIQSTVIGSNVIGKIILDEPDTSDILIGTITKDNNAVIEDDIKMAGATLANDVFISFFTPVDENEEPKCINTDANEFVNCLNEVKSDESSLLGNEYTLGNTYLNVNKTGKFSEYRRYSGNVVGDEKTIGFNWLMQLLVGVFIVYVFISFCIDMGLRTVKLCYYELIAPIPILTMIIPGQKKIFDNWKKNTISTFLEVFIRIIVVFFVLLLIRKLPSLADPIWDSSLLGTPSNGVKLFARIFIIVGLLMFMKQAPKLFSDLFGISSGSFKLGIADKLREATDFSSVPVIGRAQGAVTGAAGAAWSAAWNPGGSFRKGLKTGFYNGLKGKGNQFAKQRQQFYSKNMDGEGTAGIFGKRNWIEKKTAQTSKEAKNAYRSGNFKRVLGIQKSDQWKDLYNKSYNNVVTELTNNINKIKNKILAEQNAYDTAENGIKQKIVAAQQNKTELNTAQQTFANFTKMFEAKKNGQKAQIQKEYEAAVAKKDISAQLDAQKRLNELDAMKYHNPELENKIKELSAKDTNVAALEGQLSQIQLQRKNDANLDALGNSLTDYRNQLDKVEKEHEYITTGQLDINGKMVERSYRTEEEFVKRYGGFTDALSKADAEMFKVNPEYKDFDSSHKKWLMETGVTQFINSEEGQRAIAVREIAEKNLQSKGGSSAKNDGGSGDKK